MKKWVWSVLFALVIVALSAKVIAAETKKLRDYPGGADEEDIKVQAELPTPPLKVDRKSIEQKALQAFLKKDGSAPASEGEPKPDERR